MTNDQEFAELQWRKFPVLDKGWVCLVDRMGDDAAIVQAARTSYGEGTSKTSDDETLIRYLLRHKHTTPFEMAEIKLLVHVPMDCWRQWIRTRTASVNEYSTRYSVAIDEMQETPADEWRLQTSTNRQGSDGLVDAWPEDAPQDFLLAKQMGHDTPGKYLSYREGQIQDLARSVYEERLRFGVAREQARKDLPLSTYTQAYFKIDLHNFLHFLSLRMASDAQQEIREYATIIGEQIVKPLFPLTWQAFLDYRFNAMQLTALDIGVIQMLKGIRGTKENFLMACPAQWKTQQRCRERDECWEKLLKLGIVNE